MVLVRRIYFQILGVGGLRLNVVIADEMFTTETTVL